MVAKTVSEKLIIAQMALDGINGSTIHFFILCRDKLQFGATNIDTARSAFMSSQAASRHLRILEKRGYITKTKGIGWVSNEHLVKDKDLIRLGMISGCLVP